ncbi:HAMP domain-containing protein [Hyphomicrobium sp. 99]|uniref:HAMP domain-containing protein n=1 Tax=Hyphomicrobium sp. 99 TaxID=1163419 RepID=UPI0005F84A16|nr:HAMP domain-containing protein [Hyphomicrobium sp. 99]
MPLRRRLLALVALVLALCLIAGGALSYWHGLRKVDLEMSSAIDVAASAVSDALSTMSPGADARAQVLRLLSSFDGDRHIRVSLVSPDGKLINASRLQLPSDPPPRWLYWLLSGSTRERTFDLPGDLRKIGTITIAADSHNEVGEVWEDLKLKFAIIGGFCGVVLALIYASLGRALRPLEQLSSALDRVGDGDYTAHVSEDGPDDLKRIYRAFNRMAEQLRDSEQQNQRLNEQLSTVQEEERSEIARDLHDEIGPFLFAADVDAQAIPLLVSRQANDEVVNCSKAIRQSVQHMQVHLRGVLSRLRPAHLIDQGLPIAVEQLIGFWKARRPQIDFQTDIEDERFPTAIEEVAFRILQEGTSNAVRHGQPGTIGLTVRRTEGGMLRIVVSDDGSGITAKTTRGFGLAGMRERVASLDGRLSIADQKEGKGVMLIVEIPLPASSGNSNKHEPLTTSAA